MIILFRFILNLNCLFPSGFRCTMRILARHAITMDRDRLSQNPLESEETMAVRTSSAEWKGTLKEGAGTMKVGGGAYEGPYTHASRFETGPGTNPEELIGAAHAGCYS